MDSHVYNPLQAGSIDATDTTPHDNGIRRAIKALAEGKFKPHMDPKIKGNPKKTVFVWNLSFQTTDSQLKDFFRDFGRVVNVRVVRCVATGMSKGYGFVEFKHSADFEVALQRAHNRTLDGRAIFVEAERGRVMKNWIPRRFGGGVGGRKESGQLRFGGRVRPHKPRLSSRSQHEQQSHHQHRTRSHGDSHK